MCVYAREGPETRVTHQRLGGHLQRAERTPLCTDGGLRAQLVPLRPGCLAGLLSLWASSWGVSGVGAGQSQPRERAEDTTVSPSPTEPSLAQPPPTPARVTITAFVVICASLDFNSLGWGAGIRVGGRGGRGGEAAGLWDGVQVEVAEDGSCLLGLG